MRYAPLIASIALVACSSDATPASATRASTPAATPAAPATAASTAKRINFALPLSPIKQKDLAFSMFKDRWSLLFYFSPTCGHCQHTYPLIQSLRSKYEKRGMGFVAIATGTASPEDIQFFDQDYSLNMPAFQDVTREFGKQYGTGSVPLILLVKPDGSYRLWNNDLTKDTSAVRTIDSTIRAGLHLP